MRKWCPGPGGSRDGSEKNWVQIALGKGWFVILRLYGSVESWFDKSWKPGEIEPLK